MAVQGYDLNDMMTALQGAHEAGNTADAQQIAGLISQHYPGEAHAALHAPGSNRTGVQPFSLPAATEVARQVANPGPSSAPSLPVSPALTVDPNSLGHQILTNQAQPAFGPTPSAGSPAAMTPGGKADAAGTNPFGNNWLGGLLTGLHSMVNTATFGLEDSVLAPGLAAGMSQFTSNPMSMGQAQQAVQGNTAANDAQHPWMSGLGTAAGIVAGPGAVGGAARGAGALAGAVGLTGVAAKAQKVADMVAAIGSRPLVGGATTGAATAGVDSWAHGGSGSDVLSSMALGGAMGGVVGKGADLAITKLEPLAARSWDWLAQKINSTGILTKMAGDAITRSDPGLDSQAARYAITNMQVDPEELAQTHADLVAANGNQPVPLAASLSAVAQRKLANVASSTAAGNDLADASAAWQAQGPTHIPALIDSATSGVQHAASPTGAAGVQTIGDLEAARDNQMSQAMSPIRGAMVPIFKNDVDALNDPALQSALSGRAKQDLRTRVGDAITATRMQSGQGALSIDDLDNMRQSLGRRAGSLDPTIAEPSAEARDSITDIASRHPDYADALDRYGQHSAYIDGFKQGVAGKSLDQVEGASAALARPDTGLAYQQGHASGLVSGLAQKASTSEANAQSVLQTLSQNNAMRQNLNAAYGPDVTDDLATMGGKLSQATAAMRNVAPSGPVAPADNAAHAANEIAGRVGLAAMMHHPLAAAYHGAQALVGLLSKNNIPASAVSRLADMLGDPQRASQAIATLRRSGVDQAQIQRMIALASGQGGQTASGLVGTSAQ